MAERLALSSFAEEQILDESCDAEDQQNENKDPIRPIPHIMPPAMT
jgi:hypothetical protein